MQELSVVIICQDEERTIASVLTSVATLTDDVIVVDSGSTDSTTAIANKLGAQCHYKKWLGYSGQKNFAISLAKRTWILSLDADEIVTEALAAEIETTLARYDLDNFDGFRIPRLLYIGEVALAHGGFYPDSQLRLFRRGKGLFRERKVHESVFVEGKTETLKHHLIHRAYPNLDAYSQALDKYARLSAEEFAERPLSPWHTSKLNEWVHPVWTFILRYCFRLGFLDGTVGLAANRIYMDYVRKKISYLREALLKNKKT